MGSRITPFGWFGGKYNMLDWLLPLLPKSEYFVDVFGGSGVVLLNRKPAKFTDVFNDIDRDLVTFFRVLRDDPQPLLDALRLTPYSREEYRIACTREDGLSDLERARWFFVRTVQSFGAIQQSWAASIREIKTDRTGSWRRFPDRLARVADRLLDVQVECLPAVELIPRYDRAGTLFYCDPPYVHSTRSSTSDYAHEMSDDDHRELADVLSSIKGRAAVSGYRSGLYDEIYAGWTRTDAQPRRKPMAGNSAVGQECLWTNYDPQPHQGEQACLAG